MIQSGQTRLDPSWRPHLPGWRGRRDRPPPPPKDETLLERRPLYVIAVGLALLALLLQQPLLVVAGVLVGVLAFVPELWYRFGLRGLAIQRRPAVRQAMFGDEVDVVLTLENRQPLPLPWLELTDEFPESLPITGARFHTSTLPDRVRVESTCGLWAYQRLRRRMRLRCVARGAFQFGPITVRLTDPFSILTREERREENALLLVYPLVAPIERFGLPARSPFGEQKSAQRLLEDPLRMAGVRPYTPGDEPRRIHWKATARMAELQSKVYEPATRHSLALFLDTRTFERTVYGYDPLLVELAISAAASVATWALDQGFAVGIYANGVLTAPELERRPTMPLSQEHAPADGAAADDANATQAEREAGALLKRQARMASTLRLRIPPASNPTQLTRVLDGLARLLPFGGLAMEHILGAEQGRLPPGTAIVYIGAEASVDVPLILALRRLKSTGHAITLLLTGSQGPDAPTRQDGAERPALYLSGLTTHRLGGRELWREMVAEVVGRRFVGDTNADTESARPPSDDGGAGAERQPAPRALVVE